MCFFNGNNCNCRPNRPTAPTGVTARYVIGATGPRGPQGATGATGAQGPQGERGLQDALYALGGTGTVASDAIIPINLNVATTNSTITVTNNQVIVPAGVYLISYGVSGAVIETAGNMTVTLYAGGTALSNGEITEYAETTQAKSLAKTIMYRATTAVTLSLYNTSDSSITLGEAFLTVVRFE